MPLIDLVPSAGVAAQPSNTADAVESVAMRVVRLTHLSRNQPEAAATVELTRAEIDAVLLLREPKGVHAGATPTIAQATRWIADLGG